MEPIVIGKHCTVTLIEEVPCIMIKWNGLPPGEEFKRGCNTVLDLMQKHKIIKKIKV